MNKELEMTPNVLVEFLQKPATEFTKEDISVISMRKISRWLILCILQATDV